MLKPRTDHLSGRTALSITGIERFDADVVVAHISKSGREQ